MPHIITQRAQDIKSFIAMDILEAACKLENQGRSIISFSLGEPDFSAPEAVQEACIQAIRDHQTKYTHSQGLLPLREAIASHYYNTYKVNVNPEQILVTQGTSPAFFLIFSSMLEKGDEVVLPNPHYPCDANFVSFQGGKVVYLPIFENEDYQWNIDEIKKRITKKTKALFVTSPSNPTGTVLSYETLKKLAGLKKTIVSDEIYHGLVYEGKEHTALEFTQNTFVVNGFSKAYAMTGYRLGYVIAPRKFVRPMQKIQQNFYISANSFVQWAAIAALKEGGQTLATMRQEYKRRRDVLLEKLEELGFHVNYKPTGAFYVFVDVRHISRNSYKLAFDILNKVGVAITPGIDFGSRGEGFLRFSYAVSVEKIEEGMERLKTYLETYAPKKVRKSMVCTPGQALEDSPPKAEGFNRFGSSAEVPANERGRRWIKIVPMQASHLEAVLLIGANMAGSPLTLPLLQSELEYPLSKLWVALCENEIIGFIIYRRILDESDILYLAVHPKMQREGVAGQLLEWMVSVEPGLRQITLEVRASNHTAQKFYEGCGFSVLAKRTKYYHDGEDALVMMKTLSSPPRDPAMRGPDSGDPVVGPRP